MWLCSGALCKCNDVCFTHVILILHFNCATYTAGADPEKAIGAIAPPNTYKINFFHRNFVRFGKQNSLYKVIFCPLFFQGSVVKYTSSLL